MKAYTSREIYKMETKTYKKNEANMMSQKRCNYMKTDAKNHWN